MNMPPAPLPPPEAPEALAQLTEGVEPIAPRQRSQLLRDHVWHFLLGVTLLTNLALFGYLFLRFDALPDRLPLHFDASGLADRIEVKTGIFWLPVVGLLVFLLNTGLGIPAHRRERAATLLLSAGALLAQILMWLATISLAGNLF